MSVRAKCDARDFEIALRVGRGRPEQARVFKVKVFGMLDTLAEASGVSKMKVVQ